ncbi:hypothetical protein [Phaeobacter sp. S60]|jgi:putative flavoprotein involved in K+ transport|nr:hypothetical protein [Phaeobacter sp. S60]
MYFLGLGRLHTWGSGRFLGVGGDAAFVTDAIIDRHLDQGKRWGNG